MTCEFKAGARGSRRITVLWEYLIFYDVFKLAKPHVTPIWSGFHKL